MLRRHTAVVVMAVLYLGATACLPGDRAKTIIVTNQCQEAVWLRFTDRPEANDEQMTNRKAYEAGPGKTTTVKGSVLDPEDGLRGSMAVSATPDAIGRIVALPPSVGEEIRVTIAGDFCRM